MAHTKGGWPHGGIIGLTCLISVITAKFVAKGQPEKMTVARTVRDYIDKRPVVKDAIRMGIVNLSALTRRIITETDLDQEEAVLVACRRYPATSGSGYEDDVRRVLQRSKLEVRTRVAVWTLRPGWRLFARLEKLLPRIQGQSSQVHVLHGSEAVTLIADETLAKQLEEALEPEDIMGHETDLVELNLRTPERIEEVRGILAFVATSLASRGVNFLEVISCHKDNMFLISSEDLFTAFEVLNQLIRP